MEGAEEGRSAAGHTKISSADFPREWSTSAAATPPATTAHSHLDVARTGKRPRGVPKKHLYLVLDDWHKGFSIRKIDVDALQDTTTDLHHGFPDPAALRLVAPVKRLHMDFTTMGSDIFITTNPCCPHTPTLVFDTETAGLTMGPCPPF
ncbi:hypothetical protein TRIUR3_22876 [Triticum urartu]|uniref:Uncharacterized protein n=1 Tax=Triticum urartu TaxID=4572 RepID=M7ZLV1_TRIUA|nr:hypothetical protein TRIUR3_22876 [Triticum urartu]